MRIVESAHAKINLFLEILDRRGADEPFAGYHNIDSIMSEIDLHDVVTIERKTAGNSSVTLSCSEPSLPTDARNTAYRAAEYFLRTADTSAQLHIHIEKHIPQGAGLGGGSADAAAVLRGLNRLFGEPLTRSALLEIAAAVGADVPFCLIGGTARVQGIGEIITPLRRLELPNIEVAIEGEGVDTKWAYALLDEARADTPTQYRSADRMAAAINAGDEGFFEHRYNAFEAVILPRRPQAAALLQRMSEGEGKAMMSGSGAAIYAIFNNV